MIPVTLEEAVAAGRAASQGTVPLHDLAGHMGTIGIPPHLQGAWLSGLEAGLEDQDFDGAPDSDAHDWERRALSPID